MRSEGVCVLSSFLNFSDLKLSSERGRRNLVFSTWTTTRVSSRVLHDLSLGLKTLCYATHQKRSDLRKENGWGFDTIFSSDCCSSSTLHFWGFFDLGFSVGRVGGTSMTSTDESRSDV